MGLFNGTGFSRRGWRRSQDDRATATVWVTVSYLPLLPLRRELLVFKELAEARPRGLRGFFRAHDFELPALVIERLPLAFGEIVRTYVWTYLLVPLLCLWPFFAYVFAAGVYTARTGKDRLELPDRGVQGLICFMVLNTFVILLVAIRRARGVSARATLDTSETPATAIDRPDLARRYPVGERVRQVS